MKEEIVNIRNEAVARISEAADMSELEEIRVSYLGRNGKLNEMTKQMSGLSSESKKGVGILINETKETLFNILAEQENRLKNSTRNWFDPTIPGIKPGIGHLHPMTIAIDEIVDIFKRMGFVRARYPEVEWDFFAFEALNIPKGHPARDEWETFFINAPEDDILGKMVLTPHTSSGQVREMQRVKPPIRMINISKNYRKQADATHVPMLHQFEGLVIDRGINITHLKGTVDYFVKHFFGSNIKTRLRPHNFKFTEPSFEVDISCMTCMGSGQLPSGGTCRVCKEGWLEQAGAGMVHPNVLKNGGINPKIYSGFAFGWGVERAFMMKPGLKLSDIRLLYSCGLQNLNQFI